MHQGAGLTERSPLLMDESPLDSTSVVGQVDQQNGQSYRRPSRSSSPNRRLSTILLIIPVAVLHRFAGGLSITTSLRLLQTIACQIWFIINDPTAFPPGRIPQDSCSRPEVDKYYSMIMTIMTTINGVGSVVAYSISSHFVTKYGRKPILLIMVMFAALSLLSFLMLQYARGWFQIAFLISTILCDFIGDTRVIIFAINVYVLDTAKAEDRTVWLSKIAGCAALGGALSSTVGGSITTYMHNTTTVYIVAISCLLVVFTYTLIMVPETSSLASRQGLQEESSRDIGVQCQPSDSANIHGWIKRFKDTSAVILEPFEVLKPMHSGRTGKRNWRLVYCAIHIFIVYLAEGYAMVAAVLYFSTQYGYSPAQTGYVLTLSTLASTVALIVFVPFLVDLLKPFYKRKLVKNQAYEDPLIRDESQAAEESSITLLQGPEETPNCSSDSSEEISYTSDHLDVHIVVASWVIEAVSYIGVGLVRSLPGQMMAICGVGLGAGKSTAFRSLVAGSVHPSKQGEALAAIEMVGSMALIISPVLMGSIITATITTVPQAIFYVHAVTVLVGSSILFLVRDVDGFQQSTGDGLNS